MEAFESSNCLYGFRCDLKVDDAPSMGTMGERRDDTRTTGRMRESFQNICMSWILLVEYTEVPYLLDEGRQVFTIRRAQQR